MSEERLKMKAIFLSFSFIFFHATRPRVAVEAACGVRPQLPTWLDGLMTKPEQIKVIKNDSAEVERFVLSVSRAAKQGVAG